MLARPRTWDGQASRANWHAVRNGEGDRPGSVLTRFFRRLGRGAVVFKNALRTVLTLSLLVAGYFGYREGFKHVRGLVPTIALVPIVPYSPSPSRTEREMKEVLRTAFGPDHWTSSPDVFTYYDAHRGYWLISREYARLNDGRRLVFSPFAAVWNSRNGPNLNTAVGNRALVDFDRPFEFARPGSEPAKIVHALIEGEVHLRDDKGTTNDLQDDFTIGPLTRVEYDQAKNLIVTDSDVHIHDRDVVATAKGATLYLRSNERANQASTKPGFAGVRTVVLHEKVHVVSANVGRIGIVPGGRPSDSGAARPGEVLCDGQAQIDLPPPRPRGEKGPRDPVVARFNRNVIVRQGHFTPPGSPTIPPDQLNADQLTLTLVPKPAAPSTRSESAGPDDKPAAPTRDDGLSGLTLQVAEATGHAVWLQSPSQGFNARGNQLIYKKLAPERNDSLYFRGDNETWVEKANVIGSGPDRGKVSSIDTIRTVDITIYQPLAPGETATVIARGPGSIETRPGRNQPVERTATWGDRLTIQQVPTSGNEERQRLLLTGSPSVRSASQGSLKASEKIVAFLTPKDAAAPARRAATGTRPAARFAPRAGDALRIDWVEAHGNVVLKTAGSDHLDEAPERPQDGQSVRVRDRLDVIFVPVESAATQSADGNATTPGAPPAPNQSAALPSNANPTPPEGPSPATAARPSTLDVQAERGWARIALRPNADRPEVREVQLMGNVVIHQGPPPGKTIGNDVTAQKVVLLDQGGGLARFEAHGDDRGPARVTSDALMIEGPLIGVDQAKDFAWVTGAGKLRQEGPRTAIPPNQAKGQAEGGAVRKTAFAPEQLLPIAGRGPVEIVWGQEMQFFGRPTDEVSQGHANAIFLGGVNVTAPESTLQCGQMRAYLDGPYSFQKAEKGQARPTPRIVMLYAFQSIDPRTRKPVVDPATHQPIPVDLVHRSIDPETGALTQKGRVSGPKLSFDLTNGAFLVDGAGTVWLYKPRPTESAAGNGPIPGMNLRPTMATVPRARADRRAGTGTPTTTPTGTASLELTRVNFQRRVAGRVGDGTGVSGLDNNRQPPFVATFDGGVQVLHAPVADERADLDPDDPPPDYMLLASEQIKVIREAAHAASSGTQPALEQFFIDATGGPLALSPPRSLKGDRITYDSVKDLVYVYGDEGGVSIVNQDAPGQPFSATRGQAIMYNRKSGHIKVISPQNMLVVDPRSGIRARPVPPSGPSATPAPKPATPRRGRGVPQSDKERQGFTR